MDGATDERGASVDWIIHLWKDPISADEAFLARLLLAPVVAAIVAIVLLVRHLLGIDED
jgi:hypothetical protein